MLTLTQQLDEFSREMEALSERHQREADEIARTLGDVLLHTFGFSEGMLRSEVEKAQGRYAELVAKAKRLEERASQACAGYWLEINSPVDDGIRSAWEPTRVEAFASGRVRQMDQYNRIR